MFSSRKNGLMSLYTSLPAALILITSKIIGANKGRLISHSETQQTVINAGTIPAIGQM